MNTHSVVIVEDEPNSMRRFKRVVQEHAFLNLADSASDYESGAVAVRSKKPDVLLVDLGLPDKSGVDLISYARECSPQTEAIVITVFGDETHVMKAIGAGASGYVLKDDDSLRIGEAIELMLNGGAPISASIARHLLNQFRSSESETDSPTLDDAKFQTLTVREREILLLLSNGYTDREIAEREHISYNTVTTHVKRIYKKLSVNTRVDATREAMRLGLVNAGQPH